MQYKCRIGTMILVASCFASLGCDSEAEQAVKFIHQNISARLSSGQATAEFQHDADRVVNESVDGTSLWSLDSYFNGKDKYGREARITFSAMVGRRTDDGDGWTMYLLSIDGNVVETELMRNVLKNLQEKKER